MFRRAIVTGTLVGLLLTTFLVSPLFSGTVKAYQHNPPFATRYTFDYPEGPDTTTVDALFQNYVGTQAGYYVRIHNDQSSWSATTFLPDDAIFSFFGHGRGTCLFGFCWSYGGYIKFWNGSNYSSIKANEAMGDWLAPNCSPLSPVQDLWDMRLIVLTGCFTACRFDSGDWWTSLTEQANAMGVDCSLGFSNSIYSMQATNWEVYFWSGLGVSGYSVSNAAYYAAQTVLYYFGDYGRVDTYSIQGNANITIKPAAYGS
jgi:hypothetical protein